MSYSQYHQNRFQLQACLKDKGMEYARLFIPSFQVPCNDPKRGWTNCVLEGIEAGFGRGDLSGRLEVKQGETFQVIGRLHSQLLDLDAFEGVSWTRPPTRLFSTDPLPTKWLRNGRVDVSYEADSIILANTLMTNGVVQVYMTDGVLSANPIRAEFLDGVFDSSLLVNARGYLVGILAGLDPLVGAFFESL